MPTFGDETLRDRYAREHADHLARLAKMTPEQIAEMELSLHNAMAELDRLRAKASQGGEAVEVVAWQDAENPLYTTAERRVMHDWAGNGYPIVELMTVAQHQRILAAATHPADQVAEPVTKAVPVKLLERISCESIPATPEEMMDMADDFGAAIKELRALLADSGGVKK